jgi:CRISPR/Cas system CSM-associated protein Csm2 small subunit
MTDIADLYLQLGSAGFIAVLFGFMIYNLIQSQKEQSEDLESIKQSISKMETEISNSQNISIKLVDRMNRGDEKREEFWREISDDLSFIKAKLTNGFGRH